MNNFKNKDKIFLRKDGFTLLEILLVVAAIAILAGIVILAINPTKQLGDTRNAQRRADINTISNGMYQYVIAGNLLSATNLQATTTSITTCAQLALATTTEICKTGSPACFGRTDLSAVTASSTFLVAIPSDPIGATATGTGYYTIKDANSRIIVCTPSAENNATIFLTR